MKTRKEDYERAYKICSKYSGHENRIRKANGDQNVINVIATIEKREEGNPPALTVKQFCDGLILRKLKLFAQHLPDEGYSMGSYVRVHFNKLTQTDDRTKNYSNSYKFKSKVKHGKVEYTLTKKEYLTFQIVGGVITFIDPNQKSRVKKCTWIAGEGSKNTFKLTKVEGYIYAGYHSTSKNGALLGGKLNIERAKVQERIAKEQLKNKVKNEKEFRKALRLQYSYQDSIDCGNCETGTRAFILRLRLDEKKKYRGNFLIKKATEKSPFSLPYITKMIRYKINHSQ